MDNLVDQYLEFKAYNISEYTRMVIEYYNPRFRLTNKLIDIVYDYLNEIYLGGDYASNTSLTKTTGLSLDADRNSIMALFIDYAVISRMALKSKETSSIYSFIVDTILFFIRIESLTNTSKFGCDSFDSAVKRALRDGEFENEAELNEIFKTNPENFIAFYDDSLRRNNEFNSYIRDNAFELVNHRIDDGLFMSECNYNNEELFKLEEKDVNYVKEKYEVDLFLAGLEIITIDLIQDLLLDQKKKVLVKIPKGIATKKSLMKVVLEKTKVFAVKRNLLLVFDYSVIEKDKNYLSSLYDKGYDFAVNKDGPMPKNFDLGSSKYLLLEYFNDDEFKGVFRRVGESVGVIITNKLNKVDKLECLGLGIKYFIQK